MIRTSSSPATTDRLQEFQKARALAHKKLNGDDVRANLQRLLVAKKTESEQTVAKPKATKLPQNVEKSKMPMASSVKQTLIKANELLLYSREKNVTKVRAQKRNLGNYIDMVA